jgi:hypothetical protein
MSSPSFFGIFLFQRKEKAYRTDNLAEKHSSFLPTPQAASEQLAQNVTGLLAHFQLILEILAPIAP